MRTLTSRRMSGTAIGIRAGRSMLLIAELVTMSIARPYSGRAVPSMIPGISRNWRRTSGTTWPPPPPAHLGDAGPADAPARLHRQRGEEKRHQPADEEAGDHPRVVEPEDLLVVL